MKNARRAVSITLALLTAASLFGCDDTAPSGGDVTTAVTTSPDTAPVTAVTEAEPSVPEDSVLWAACKDGKYGFINEKGEFVIEPKYKDASAFFDNGLARVTFDTLINGEVTRFIDRSGEFIFSTAFTSYDEYAHFDESGLALIHKDNLYGFMDATGEFVIEPQFDMAYPFGDRELALILMDEKYGYINRQGKVVIEPQFDSAYYFTESGLAMIGKQVGTESYTDEYGEEYSYPVYEYGFIDTEGNVVIEPQFDTAGEFAANGLAPVTLDGKPFYIDRTGAIIINAEFDWIYSFDDSGYALVGNHVYDDAMGEFVEKYGLIDSTGAVAVPVEYDDLYDFADNGLALAMKDDAYFHIRTDGTPAYGKVFEDAYDFSDNGLAAVLQNGKYGYINESGEFVIEPAYDEAYDFDENGYAIVGIYSGEGETEVEGEVYTYPTYKYGVIDSTGELVVPMEFDDILF